MSFIREKEGYFDCFGILGKNVIVEIGLNIFHYY